MGGNQFAVRVMGVLIVAVMAIAGVGTIAVLSSVDMPQLEVSYLFVPWAAVATAGMTLLWVGTAIAVYLRIKVLEGDQS